MLRHEIKFHYDTALLSYPLSVLLLLYGETMADVVRCVPLLVSWSVPYVPYVGFVAAVDFCFSLL